MHTPELMPTRGRIALAFRCLLAAIVVVVIAAAVPASASAHAQLDTSDPSANAILPTAPSQVVMGFTERLEHTRTNARLFGQDGQEVAGATSRPGEGPRALILDLPPGLSNGTYSVVWQTLSIDDGHPAQGYFAFTVGTEADVQAVVPPATTSTSGAPEWLRTASRWAALIGLALAAAIWPVWLLVLRPGIASAWRSGPELVRRARGYADGVIVFALLGNLFAMGVQAADLPSDGFLENLRTTLLDTRYGELWIARIALLFVYAAALAAAPWWRPRQRPWRTLLTLGLALALPLPFSLISHASAETTGRTAAIAIDYLHLTSAAMWVGGLFLLVAVLAPLISSLRSEERRAVLVRAIPRFSAVALVGWAIMGASGSYAAWLQIGSLDGLTETSYGRSLIAKLLILLPLLGFGAFNLLVVTRRINAASNEAATLWARRFRVAITLEAVLMVLLFVAVGRLTSLQPARATLAAEGNAIHRDLEANGQAGTLTLTPGATGPNHYRLELSGEPLPVDTEGVLRLTLDGQDLGQQELALTRAAGNAFEGHGSELSIAGDWSIVAIVRKIGEFQWQDTTAVDIAATAPPSRAPGPAWHFDTGGVAGIALIVASVIGFGVAWSAGRNRLRRESAILSGAALALGVVLLLQSRVDPVEAEAGGVALAAVDEAAIVRGEEIYLANCATCHGAAGQGDGPAAAGLNPPPADLTSPLHRAHRPEDLALWVTNGLPGTAMPGFGETLSESEINDVVAYIQSLSRTSSEAAADVISPDPSECQIDPVHPRDFFELGSPAATDPDSSAPVGSNAFPWPRGEDANDAAVDGVTRTVREFVACASAGDYPRRLALYTNDYIAPQFAGLDEAGRHAAIDLADTAPAPLPADQRGWIRSISEVREQADGRVAAHVVTEDPVNHPHVIRVVLVFAEVGDRWLIDEIHQDTSSGTPTSAP
ncbi:MAG: copper resistance protein CopC [Thermomicrobiales bacterium]